MRLVVADDRALRPAHEDLVALLDRVDKAASRFRPDSELSGANARAGLPTPVSRLLVELVDAALGAAAATDGAVDPTLGQTLRELGYDRDIALLRASDVSPTSAVDSAAALAGAPPSVPTNDRAAGEARPGHRWSRIRLDRRAGLLTVPRGVELDLGATAKAWTADLAARTFADRYGTGVLVELGGDLAVAGPAGDGWRVRVAERAGGPGQVVTVRHGGVATSTTTLRTWQRDGQRRHHVIDPRSGQPTDGPWRTASVWAATGLEANMASTAALVLGADALAWLTQRGFAARLVAQDGSVTTTAGWPRPTDTSTAPAADTRAPTDPDATPEFDQVFRRQGHGATRATSPTPENVILAGAPS